MHSAHSDADVGGIYGDLAPVYDRWIAGDPARLPSEAFYARIGMKAAGVVAELGVGTGRIAARLAQAGVSVIGVDTSPAMLTQARRRLDALGHEVGQRVTLIQGDVTAVHFDRPVSTALLPFRTIGHFHAPARLRALLDNVATNLTPGGRFVFDHYVFNLDAAMAADGVAAPVTGDNADEAVTLWHTHRVDQGRRQLCSSLVVRDGCRDPEGQVLQRADYRLGWIEEPDVVGAASDCGFEVIDRLGSFDGEPFGPQSSEQIWILKRRG